MNNVSKALSALNDHFEAEHADMVKRYLATVREVEATLPAPVPYTRRKDMFAPPKTPVAVRCMHCNAKYQSSKIKYEYRLENRVTAITAVPTTDAQIEPMWWCKDEDCDGAGFGFDILEIGKRTK